MYQSLKSFSSRYRTSWGSLHNQTFNLYKILTFLSSFLPTINWTHVTCNFNELLFCCRIQDNGRPNSTFFVKLGIRIINLKLTYTYFKTQVIVDIGIGYSCHYWHCLPTSVPLLQKPTVDLFFYAGVGSLGYVDKLGKNVLSSLIAVC